MSKSTSSTETTEPKH